MEKSQIKILATKKLSVEQLRMFNKEINVTDTDFIDIRYNRLSPNLVKEPIGHVIITSKNALEGLLFNFTPDELRFKNIYCVGRKTKALVESKIGKVSHYEKYGEDMANYLTKNLKEKEVTFFCSDIRREEIPSILTKNGFGVNEVEVYRTVLKPKPFEEEFDAILFFSPSGVKSFVEMNTFGSSVAYCIGKTTAKEAKKYTKDVVISHTPLVESVIELVNKSYV